MLNVGAATGTVAGGAVTTGAGSGAGGATGAGGGGQYEFSDTRYGLPMPLTYRQMLNAWSFGG